MTYGLQTAQSLHRIAFLLRGLLKNLNGEDWNQCDAIYPEFEHYTSGDHDMHSIHGHDDNTLPAVDLTELEELVDQLGDDWAWQREIEIMRLERENEELRQMLKIDAQSMADSGVALDLDAGRGSTFTGPGRRQVQRHSSSGSPAPGGDPVKLLWTEGNQQQQELGQSNSAAHRMADFQPGMRMGSQVRRPGIIGVGQQRGLLVSGGLASTTGNGLGLGNGQGLTFDLDIGPLPSTGATSWSNPPAVSPAPPLVVERPWPAGPGLDLSR